MNKLGKSQEGSALIIVIVAIIVLSGASAAFLAITVHRNRESVMARDYTKAFYSAEAGVSASFAEISADQDYDSDGKGDVTGTFDGGNYSVTATDDGNDLWTITATGAYNGSSRTVELRFRCRHLRLPAYQWSRRR